MKISDWRELWENKKTTRILKRRSDLFESLKRVPVTEQDFAREKKYSTTKCALARAIKRATPKGFIGYQDAAFIKIYDRKDFWISKIFRVIREPKLELRMTVAAHFREFESPNEPTDYGIIVKEGIGWDYHEFGMWEGEKLV